MGLADFLRAFLCCCLPKTTARKSEKKIKDVMDIDEFYETCELQCVGVFLSLLSPHLDKPMILPRADIECCRVVALGYLVTGRLPG